MVPAGKLNHLIDILAKQSRRDHKTGATIEKFEPRHRRMSAQRLAASGGKVGRSLQVEEKTTALFTIRYIRDISQDMRIKDHGDGKEFEIVDISDPDGKGMWLNIQASEIV